MVSFLGISIHIRRKTGRDPNVFPKDESAYALIGFYFKMTLFVLFVYSILLAAFPEIVFSAWIIRALDIDFLKYAGIAFMIIAFAWVFTAQVQMKNSWRIGIDRSMKTELITHGLFRFSRNPIFMGMMVSLFGFFLAFPTVINLAFYVVGNILMQIQIRLEEEHLLKEHGQAYLDYKKRVGRLFIFMNSIT